MNHSIVVKTGAFFMSAFMLLTGVIPALPAQAASNPPVGLYSALQDDEDDEDEDEDYSRYSRSRYSGTLGRKIRALDDDEVENLPIPIIMGVRLANIWPNFGDPRDGGARQHEGLDIMAPRGAAIGSPTEAVVTRTGKGSGSGTYVQTANPGGETFYYYHLDEIADGIKAGTELEVGDILGYVGNTGNASGGAPHLHWEIRDGRRATDPFPRLTKEFSDEVRIRYLTGLLEELQKELARLLRN